MDRVARHDERVIAEIDELAAVLAREPHGDHPELACGGEPAVDARGLAARRQRERDIAALAVHAQRVRPREREVVIVRDRGHQRRIGRQRHRGDRWSLRDDRMHEFDGDVHRIGRAPTIAHHVQPAAGIERAGHRARARLDTSSLVFEHLFDRTRALARLADDRVANRGGDHDARPTRMRPYWKYAEHAPSCDTIVAPSGDCGVQVVPKAGQSVGFARPFRMRPLMHTGDSCVVMSSTSKRRSASCARYSARSR
jgi:hypothetical protein